MNSNLIFEVNKEQHTIVLKREFAANLKTVWKAWTTAELLDQWWGPEPCRVETKSMDFREGGHWLYCMIIPPILSGEKAEKRMWGKQVFEKIEVYQSFSGIDSFCEEDGSTNPNLPSGQFEIQFEEVKGITRVTMTSKHKSFEDLQAVLDMGFKEGIEICFHQLDILFS
jgi:uncharacterized protein YndB with AHSA1/START domain